MMCDIEGSYLIRSKVTIGKVTVGDYDFCYIPMRIGIKTLLSSLTYSDTVPELDTWWLHRLR